MRLMSKSVTCRHPFGTAAKEFAPVPPLAEAIGTATSTCVACFGAE